MILKFTYMKSIAYAIKKKKNQKIDYNSWEKIYNVGFLINFFYLGTAKMIEKIV